jgi:hypothetical protein
VAGLFALGTVACVRAECSVDLWGYLKVKRAEDPPFIGQVRSTDLNRWDLDEACAIRVNEVGTFDSASLGTPSLLATADGFTMWYRADDTEETQVIVRATSADGCAWSVNAAPALLPSEPWADKAVIAPHVIPVGEELWMYYRGSRYGNQAESDIGLATSADGISWTPHADNPVFRRSTSGWDSSLLADPHVWRADERFLMLYAAHDLATTPDMTFDQVGIGKQIGIAASWDGVAWEACGSGPALVDGIKSDNAFVIGAGNDALVYYRQTDRQSGMGGLLRLVRWAGWPGG